MCPLRPVHGPTVARGTLRIHPGAAPGAGRACAMLSARHASDGKVEALDAGADDYVTKLSGMDELPAGLRAAARVRPGEQLPAGPHGPAAPQAGGRPGAPAAFRHRTRHGPPLRGVRSGRYAGTHEWCHP